MGQNNLTTLIEVLTQGPFVPNYFQIGPVASNKKIVRFSFRLPWQPEFCMELKF